jgi:hypothetical protein
VAFAASSGLLWRGNSSGYVIYREGLVGQRKSGEGPVEDEKKLVKDPKAMRLMMLGVAMGFAPYAGHGWATFEVLSKDHSGLLDGLKPHLSDKNQVARCAASAGIIRLSTARESEV